MDLLPCIFNCLLRQELARYFICPGFPLVTMYQSIFYLCPMNVQVLTYNYTDCSLFAIDIFANLYLLIQLLFLSTLNLQLFFYIFALLKTFKFKTSDQNNVSKWEQVYQPNV